MTKELQIPALKENDTVPKFSGITDLGKGLERRHCEITKLEKSAQFFIHKVEICILVFSKGESEQFRPALIGIPRY